MLILFRSDFKRMRIGLLYRYYRSRARSGRSAQQFLLHVSVDASPPLSNGIGLLSTSVFDLYRRMESA